MNKKIFLLLWVLTIGILPAHAHIDTIRVETDTLRASPDTIRTETDTLRAETDTLTVVLSDSVLSPQTIPYFQRTTIFYSKLSASSSPVKSALSAICTHGVGRVFVSPCNWPDPRIAQLDQLRQAVEKHQQTHYAGLTASGQVQAGISSKQALPGKVVAVTLVLALAGGGLLLLLRRKMLAERGIE